MAKSKPQPVPVQSKSMYLRLHTSAARMITTATRKPEENEAMMMTVERDIRADVRGSMHITGPHGCVAVMMDCC